MWTWVAGRNGGRNDGFDLTQARQVRLAAVVAYPPIVTVTGAVVDASAAGTLGQVISAVAGTTLDIFSDLIADLGEHSTFGARGFGAPANPASVITWHSKRFLYRATVASQVSPLEESPGSG